MLPARPLPVIPTGNESVASWQEGLSSRDIRRIDALEAKLADLLDITPKGHGPCASGADVVGGNVVTKLKENRELDCVRERLDRRKICDIGPANDGDACRFLLGKRCQDEVTGRCTVLRHNDVWIGQSHLARISDF